MEKRYNGYVVGSDRPNGPKGKEVWKVRVKDSSSDANGQKFQVAEGHEEQFLKAGREVSFLLVQIDGAEDRKAVDIQRLAQPPIKRSTPMPKVGKNKRTTFQALQFVKGRAMRDALLQMDENAIVFAQILTKEELGKVFDFMNDLAAKEDTEDDDVVNWVELGKACVKGLISKESLIRLKSQLGAEFFGLTAEDEEAEFEDMLPARGSQEEKDIIAALAFLAATYAAQWEIASRCTDSWSEERKVLDIICQSKSPEFRQKIVELLQRGRRDYRAWVDSGPF